MLYFQPYYLVGFILSFLIFIFPILINILMVMVLISMKLRRYPYFVKRVLILIAKLLPWSMLDIFFISILVSMVKLFNYANIELDIAFLSMGSVVFLNVLIFKRVRLGDIW